MKVIKQFGWFIFSLTSAFHPKAKGFWSFGCNMSGWREGVWSSLPIAPLGLSSSPSHQLLHQTQGRKHARGRTGVQLLHPVTFPCSPPDPTRPEPPSSLFVSPPLCFTFAPLLLCSPSSVLSDLAWQRVMNGLLLLSSAGLVSLPQRIVPHLLVPALVCPTPTFACLWNPVGLVGLKLHAIPHIVSLYTLETVYSFAIGYTSRWE